MNRFLQITTLLSVFSFVQVDARAELQPEEVAIVTTVKSKESVTVARYYARERKIPTANICPIDVPVGESLSREDWETKVRPTIRKWLRGKSNIRCFVTVWDVPLRITKSESNPNIDNVVKFLSQERTNRIGLINGFLRTLTEMVPDPDVEPYIDLAPDASVEEIKSRLDQTFSSTQSRVTKISDEKERNTYVTRFRNIYYASVGLNMMVQSLERQIETGAANAAVQSEYHFSRGRTFGLREGRIAMEGLPNSIEREQQILAVAQMSEGVFGSIAWIDAQLKVQQQNETFSSFDNELALVAWDDYALLRWQPNYLHYRYDGATIRQQRRTFMVARLDAPTLLLTRKLIDTAIEVEKTGLTGKVYLDSRGLARDTEKQQAPGSYDDYDQSVLKTSELLKQHTDAEIVLNTQQDLFQPGDCPDAALYCGWYSLAKYIDAFDWVPGAVGYHMASSEATTLRDPNSQVWCKRMIEDGICATIGPVYEPYITAFPKPNDFFLLLGSGKFTLAESFARSNPFTSWNMVLIGDPLYNPFKANPLIKPDSLDENLAVILDESTPLPLVTSE